MINDCLHDATILSYVLSIIISVYGAGLFIWWWAKNGKSSSVFAYVTFIFVGELQESITSVLARYIRLEDNMDNYLQFVNSMWWTGRKTITMLALATLAIHMTIRVWSNRKTRETDNGQPED